MDDFAHTLPTEDDELGWELDYLGVPVHVRAGNQLLRTELPDVDQRTLRQVLEWRKKARCPACATGKGRHVEPDGARVQHFTAGVRSIG